MTYEQTNYDNSKPFASFNLDYTKKNLLKALKAEKHIIYTLSPIVTIFVVFIYVFAFYFYFTRMKPDLNNMAFEKFFTVVWCTIMTIWVVFVVAFFATFEIIRFKKARAILKHIPYQTELKVYENRLEYADENQNVISIPYNEIASIKETEEYFFVTCKNKQIIILDKNKANGYSSHLANIAYSHGYYTQSLINKKGLPCEISSQKLAKIKNQSIRLIPLCIASTYFFIFLSAFCLSNISATTGELKIVLKIISIILILLSNVFPIYSIIFGAKYKVQNLSTIKNIAVGIITLFYSSIFTIGICLGTTIM